MSEAPAAAPSLVEAFERVEASARAGASAESASRLAELVLYVSDKLADDPFLGATKLNKILFLVDFAAYGELASPLTFAAYEKLPNGPCPRGIEAVKDRLVAEGAASASRVPIGSYEQRRLRAERPANMNAFTEAELALVDRTLEKLRPLTAKELSHLTHETPAWRTPMMNATIPYFAARLPDTKPPVGPREENLARALAARLGNVDW